jgi:hypothetical protein
MTLWTIAKSGPATVGGRLGEGSDPWVTAIQACYRTPGEARHPGGEAFAAMPLGRSYAPCRNEDAHLPSQQLEQNRHAGLIGNPLAYAAMIGK